MRDLTTWVGSVGAALALMLGTACTEPSSAAPAPAPLAPSDFAQPWIRMPLPPSDAFGDMETLIEVPHGYAALYRKSLGQGKISLGWEHRVFSSDDGRHWTEHDLPAAPSSVDYRSLAFGAGRYVIAGENGPETTAALTTSQGLTTWQDVASDLPAILDLAFIQDRFFALAMNRGIFSSSDGLHFSGSATDALQLSAIAYGAGSYVAVGSGPIEVSEDGMTWQSVPLDCALPGACINLPSGPPVQGYHTHAFFAQGQFYVDGFVSADARHWDAIDDPARVPDAYAGGWFLKLQGDELSAWQDGTTSASTTVQNDNPSQLDCQKARCVLVSNALLLIP